jgi:hypothetical protein
MVGGPITVFCLHVFAFCRPHPCFFLWCGSVVTGNLTASGTGSLSLSGSAAVRSSINLTTSASTALSMTAPVVSSIIQTTAATTISISGGSFTGTVVAQGPGASLTISGNVAFGGTCRVAMCCMWQAVCV